MQNFKRTGFSNFEKSAVIGFTAEVPDISGTDNRLVRVLIARRRFKATGNKHYDVDWPVKKVGQDDSEAVWYKVRSKESLAIALHYRTVVMRYLNMGVKLDQKFHVSANTFFVDTTNFETSEFYEGDD